LTDSALLCLRVAAKSSLICFYLFSKAAGHQPDSRMGVQQEGPQLLQASGTKRGKVVRIKVLSMGDMGTGKSCVIKRCVLHAARAGTNLNHAGPSGQQQSCRMFKPVQGTQ
jgi:hypothetical protein